MTLVINNKSFHYELEKLCTVFFPNEKIKVIYYDSKQVDNIVDNVIVKALIYEDDQKTNLNLEVTYYNDERVINEVIEGSPDEYCRILAVSIFNILCEFTDIRPSWGILTGVRPIKLLRRLVSELGGETNAESYFKNKLLVSEEKSNLAFQTMKVEQKILDISSERSFSLYISIPFCPTRCNYCSFVSQSVEKAQKIIPKYFGLLLDEIKLTAKIVNDLKLKLETVYIGGGTPTILSAENLHRLINFITESFNMSYCHEFTIEAGRPDTISEEKLLSIKDSINSNILRISINPQTLNDEVLKSIGRNHTSQQTIDAFKMATKLGIKNINMDIIAGLINDNYDSFKYSLDSICELSPVSITIHTLSMKRSSYLTMKGEKIQNSKENPTKSMLDYAYSKLLNEGYHPYYLYRQSKMVSNLENTGFSKPGFEGAYNVYIMDETHTILACGAGAVSKLKSPFEGKIQRIFNYKYPYEYIEDFDEICRRKEGVKDFYAKLF